MGLEWRGALLGLALCIPAWSQVQVQAPTLPAGILGSTYGTVATAGGGFQLSTPRYTASGGTAPYTFRVVSGALPAGMTLGTGGGLLGVPTATGAFTFEVRATDAALQSATVQSAITVGPRMEYQVSGRVGAPLRVERKCGVDAAAQATFSYAINGNPPPGITFVAAASVFAGTPTTEGSYEVIWGCSSVAQGAAFSIRHIFTITIGGAARISLTPGVVAPGTVLVVRGQRLAKEKLAALQGEPPPTSLGGTKVYLGTTALALLSVEEGVVQAAVPADIELVAEAPLLVVTGEGSSTPVSMLMAETTPGVYKMDGSGSGQGLVYWTEGEATPVLADKEKPAPAGAVTTLIATGLGAVDAETGKVKKAVVVGIGGVQVTEVTAIPLSGRPGEYEVKFVLPGGVTAGEAVPLSVAAGDGSSQTVTMGVK